MKGLEQKQTEVIVDDECISINHEQRSVHVLDLVLADPDIYEHVAGSTAHAYPNATAAFVAAATVGAKALRHVSVSLDMDFIGSRTERIAADLEACVAEYLRRMLDPTEADSAARRLRDSFNEQSAFLREMIGAGNATVMSVDGKLTGFSSGLEKIVREVLGSSSEGVGAMIQALQAQISELRDQILVKQVKAISGSYDKGATFEEKILEDLGQWARICQNMAGVEIQVEDLRTSNGPLGKVGDFGLTFNGNAGKRIILELKDQEKLTVPKIVQVIDRAMENRSAQIGIFVVADSASLPRELGTFSMFGDSRFVVTADTLEIAIKLGLSRLLFSENEGKDGVDIAKAAALASDIGTTARRFASLLTQIRAVIKGGENTLALATELRSSVNDGVDKLLCCLSHGKDEEAEGPALAA